MCHIAQPTIVITINDLIYTRETNKRRGGGDRGRKREGEEGGGRGRGGRKRKRTRQREGWCV
jgi:hypothetical protein